ncbi:MAG: hypothetical protein HPY50_10875 [Firmicutes bacterium]|nr:hypothetical protein [Bacillota bacterium]
MGYEIRLKTGFFETRRYHLSVIEEQLILSPVENSAEAKIIIPSDDILEIILTKKRIPEIKVQARDKSYDGVFTAGTDFDEVCGLLKRLKKTIVYKYAMNPKEVRP